MGLPQAQHKPTLHSLAVIANLVRYTNILYKVI